MRRGAWRRAAMAGACAALAACGPFAADVAIVERHETAVDILVDGSASVAETFLVRFIGGTSSSFERTRAAEQVDRFFDVRAYVDGRRLDASSAPERVSIADGDRLAVRFEFAPVSDRTHEFRIEYRASGVILPQGLYGRLRWPVAPIRPPVPVVSSEVRLTVPPGVGFMLPPAMDGEGWSAALEQEGFRAVKTGLPPEASATLVASLETDALAAAEPEWAYYAARARDLMPAFVSGGLFMVVVAAGVVWMVRLQFPDLRRRRRAVAVQPDTSDPPANLPPAMLLAVRRGRPFRGRRELRVAFEGLVARGVLREGPRRAGEARGSGISVAERPEVLSSHEQLIVDELYCLRPDEATRDRVAHALASRRAEFRRRLAADLVAAGLADAERLQAGRGLRLAGLMVLVAAALCALAVPLFLPRFGIWPYAVPAGMAAGAVLFLPAAARLSVLTERGAGLARHLTTGAPS